MTGTPPPTTVRTRFRVTAGSCAECCGSAATAVRALSNVVSVDVLSTSGLVIIELDGPVDEATIVRAAAGAGLTLASADGPQRSQRSPWWRHTAHLALAAAMLLDVVGFVLDKVLHADHAAIAPYLAAVIVGGAAPARAAIAVLRRRRLTIAPCWSSPPPVPWPSASSRKRRSSSSSSPSARSSRTTRATVPGHRSAP